MTLIVFATDSPEGSTALEWALDNRHPDGAEHLHIVLGLSDIPARPNYISDTAAQRLTERAREAGAAHTIHPPVSDTAQQVLDLAERQQARLIVLGVRRRTPTMKMLLGSHIQHILTNAASPVVCVP